MRGDRLQLRFAGDEDVASWDAARWLAKILTQAHRTST